MSGRNTSVNYGPSARTFVVVALYCSILSLLSTLAAVPAMVWLSMGGNPAWVNAALAGAPFALSVVSLLIISTNRGPGAKYWKFRPWDNWVFVASFGPLFILTVTQVRPEFCFPEAGACVLDYKFDPTSLNNLRICLFPIQTDSLTAFTCNMVKYVLDIMVVLGFPAYNFIAVRQLVKRG